MIKRVLLVIALALFGFTLYASESAKVLKIIDGDTLKIEFQGKKESIRLIGVDTPESRKNNKAYKDAYKSKQDIDTITGLGIKAK